MNDWLLHLAHAYERWGFERAFFTFALLKGMTGVTNVYIVPAEIS